MVMKAMAIAVGGVVLVVGALAAVFGLAVWLIRNNIGGLGDAFNRAVEKIKLFWRGLVDLVTKGGFSEEVSREMGKAENQGVRKFAISFFQIFYRIKRFFQGIAQGFRDAIQYFEPAFGALSEAARRLGEALGELGIEIFSVDSKSDNFNKTGYGIGAMIAGLIAVVASLITSFVELVGWVIKAGYFLGDSFAQYVLWAQEKAQAFVDTLKEVWEWLKKIGSSAIGKVVSFFTGEEAPQGTRRVGAAGRQTVAAPVRRLAPAGAPPLTAGAPSAEIIEQLRASVQGGSTSDEAIRELARSFEKRPTVVHVNMDGERVGEAIASGRRSKLARQGVPVGEEAV